MAKRFLSLDEVVAEAMSIIPGASSEEQLLAKQWAYVGLRDLGPSRDYIEVATLYPEDLTMRKPDDLYRTIDMALFNSSNQEIPSKYRGGKLRIHSRRDTRLDNYQVGSDPYFGAVEISEDDYHFFISSNSEDVAYAKLRYFRLPVDKDGKPQIPEDSRLAIMLFIRYMWSLRTMSKDVSFAEASWKQARAEVRGKNKLPHGLAYKQYAKEWMSMIPNLNFDTF
jgi:hypothetical protein